MNLLKWQFHRYAANIFSLWLRETNARAHTNNINNIKRSARSSTHPWQRATCSVPCSCSRWDGRQSARGPAQLNALVLLPLIPLSARDAQTSSESRTQRACTERTVTADTPPSPSHTLTLGVSLTQTLNTRMQMQNPSQHAKTDMPLTNKLYFMINH